MATLQQAAIMGTYVEEFQRFLVMVLDTSYRMITLLFMEGLKEPLKGLVKAFDPPDIQDAINRDLTI